MLTTFIPRSFLRLFWLIIYLFKALQNFLKNILCNFGIFLDPTLPQCNATFFATLASQTTLPLIETYIISGLVKISLQVVSGDQRSIRGFGSRLSDMTFLSGDLWFLSENNIFYDEQGNFASGIISCVIIGFKLLNVFCFEPSLPESVFLH